MTWQTCVDNLRDVCGQWLGILATAAFLLAFYALVRIVERRDRQRRERDEAEAHRQRLRMCLDPEGWQR